MIGNIKGVIDNVRVSDIWKGTENYSYTILYSSSENGKTSTIDQLELLFDELKEKNNALLIDPPNPEVKNDSECIKNPFDVYCSVTFVNRNFIDLNPEFSEYDYNKYENIAFVP